MRLRQAGAAWYSWSDVHRASTRVPEPVPSFSNLFSSRRRRARPFVIFALGRTGSTTLSRVVACHPAVTCLHEPFNPDRRTPPAPVTDGATLRRELRELRTRASGIKHVWDPDGWPFPRGSMLNRELAVQPGQRILFLNRRNVLRRLVSSQISEQAKVWAITEEDRTIVREFAFGPLDVEALSHRVGRERDAIAAYRRAIAASGTPCLDLWYEDLFEPDVTIAAQEAWLERIFAFLGVDPTLPPERRSDVHRLLRPDAGPLNSAATYRRIPGIDDVEARFGCDATGHLFR